MVDNVAVVMCFSTMDSIYLYTLATMSHTLILSLRHVLLQYISHLCHQSGESTVMVTLCNSK